jgi:hypothetical protein
MSQPALKSVGRITLNRVPTPVPRTLSRLQVLLMHLADADARLELGYELLRRDAEAIERLDRPAFLARVRAFVQDLDVAGELVSQIALASEAHEAQMRTRGKILGEYRQRVGGWLRQAGAPV